MSELLSRRNALKQCLMLLGAAGALEPITPTQAAADLPHVTPEDPTAKALGYIEDSSKVDAKANPTFQSGQTCHTCLQLQGADGATWRPCNLFPGKTVNANGWCRVWVKK